jgi:hypothetical protein
MTKIIKNFMICCITIAMVFSATNAAVKAGVHNKFIEKINTSIQVQIKIKPNGSKTFRLADKLKFELLSIGAQCENLLTPFRDALLVLEEDVFGGFWCLALKVKGHCWFLRASHSHGIFS